ncbi:MAG: hypothetical protein H6706_01540 [Myxococcales bacterium]|nr:hypothetical protein [Myxococcales bacterium]
MPRHRSRVRAADLARPDPRRGLIMLAVVAIALIIVLVYKTSMGDNTAGFLQQLVHDPDLVLPDAAVRAPDAAPATH